MKKDALTERAAMPRRCAEKRRMARTLPAHPLASCRADAMARMEDAFTVRMRKTLTAVAVQHGLDPDELLLEHM